MNDLIQLLLIFLYLGLNHNVIKFFLESYKIAGQIEIIGGNDVLKHG